MKKLAINRTTVQPKNGDIIIQLTDVQLHTNFRAPESVGKVISKKVEEMKPGRAIFPIPDQDTNLGNDKFKLSMNLLDDPNLLAMVDKYNKEGRRVIIEMPNNTPVALGKDAIQFMDSKHGRRIQRLLEKQKV